MGCTDVNTGRFITFNEDELNDASMTVHSVTGGGSIPFVFPYQNITLKTGETVLCMDGGTVYHIDIPKAVERCREVVDNDEDIIVDVVSCWAKPGPGEK